MLTVSKSELKAHMLEYFRQVEKTGEELIVTSHRKPVLKVVRLEEKKSPEIVFAEIREKAAEYGNVTDPETEEWSNV